MAMQASDQMLPSRRYAESVDDTPATRKGALGEALARLGEARLLGALLAAALLSHAYFLFQYPLILGDEGIYLQQAWSVVREGKLSPYTYFYDHAPGGWLVLALWGLLLPWGFVTFGLAVWSGRVLMVLVHLGSVALLFKTLHRLSGNLVSPTIACLVFSLSPLALYYQRMVLLDNLLVFWVLLSLFLLVCHGSRLVPVVGSGMAFAMAVLTKENSLFFLPVFVYLLLSHYRRRYSGRFAIVGWLTLAGMGISVYPLFALLKGELLPGPEHVSLVETVLWQLGRKGGGITDPNSQFWQFFWAAWWAKDAALLAAGAAATAICLMLGYGDRLRWRAQWLGGLMAAAFALYLTRGSVVLDFYVVPVLPFLAWNIGLVAGETLDRLPGLLALPAFVAVIAGISGAAVVSSHDHYNLDLTTLQRDQLAWVRQHIPAGARLVVDDDLWVDLHDPRTGAPVYPLAHSYSKVASDPAVRDDVFRNDWRNIDYLIMSNRMLEELQRQEAQLPMEAYQHSEELARFELGDVRLSVRKVKK